MHADRDDAPYRIQAKQSRFGKVFAVLAGGSVAIFGALVLIGAVRSQEKDLRAGTVVEKTAAQIMLEHSAKSRAPLHQPIPEPAVPIAEIYTPPPAQPPAVKQTSFNDSNYIPNGAANVVSYPQPIEQAEPKKEGMTVTIVKEERRLRDLCQGEKGGLERRKCRAMITLNRHD